MPECPSCQSHHTVKNSHIHNGKRRFLSKQCGRPYVEHPTNKRIDAETRSLIDRLLLERLYHGGNCSGCSSLRTMASGLHEDPVPA